MFGWLVWLACLAMLANPVFSVRSGKEMLFQSGSASDPQAEWQRKTKAEEKAKQKATKTTQPRLCDKAAKKKKQDEIKKDMKDEIKKAMAAMDGDDGEL